MICNKMSHNALQREDWIVLTEHLQIINGGQTYRAISEVVNSFNMGEFSDVYVLVRLYEVSDDEQMINDIGAKGDDDVIIENVSRVIEQSVLTFHTDMLEVSQYFLPTYRIEEQIFDIYASPERIMAGEKNKYIIVDVLSKIGKALNVDMVLVDLRAGVSEYSAPFLFDSRVNKIIVSSTSYQSVYGTGMLLQQMGKQKGNGITNIF